MTTERTCTELLIERLTEAEGWIRSHEPYPHQPSQYDRYADAVQDARVALQVTALASRQGAAPTPDYERGFQDGLVHWQKQTESAPTPPYEDGRFFGEAIGPLRDDSAAPAPAPTPPPLDARHIISDCMAVVGFASSLDAAYCALSNLRANHPAPTPPSPWTREMLVGTLDAIVNEDGFSIIPVDVRNRIVDALLPPTPETPGGQK